MNWFKKQVDKLKGIGDMDTATQPLSPITHHPSPNSPFNFFLFIFLAFLAGVVLLKPGFLQSAPQNSTQSNWTGGADTVNPGTLTSWTKYYSKDSGIVAGIGVGSRGDEYFRENGTVFC